MKDYSVMIIVLVLATVVFTVLWRKGTFLRLSGYFREMTEELKKCAWPTWDELVGSTVVVIIAVAFLGGFTVGIDFVVANLIRMLV